MHKLAVKITSFFGIAVGILFCLIAFFSAMAGGPIEGVVSLVGIGITFELAVIAINKI